MRAALIAALLAGCSSPPPAKHDTASFIAPAGQAAGAFPGAARPVSSIVSARWSSERDRDNVGEADAVIRMLGIGPGMTVADIGAGEGYYEPHLSKAVGPTGTVIAQDITPETLTALAARVDAAKMRNVFVARGEPSDPRLPVNSVNVALLIHMYHEVASPYALLWNLRAALRDGGSVAVLDAARPTDAHGTPPALLQCEMAAVGYALVSRLPGGGGGVYLAVFTPRGAPPEPARITPCSGTGVPLGPPSH